MIGLSNWLIIINKIMINPFCSDPGVRSVICWEDDKDTFKGYFDHTTIPQKPQYSDSPHLDWNKYMNNNCRFGRYITKSKASEIN